MKIRIFTLVLTVVLIAASLSSCFFFNTVTDVPASDKNNEPTNTTVNVDEVKNTYITVNGAESAEEIAIEKALLSAVSIKTDTASGSGVIFRLSEDKSVAYVLTNYHVIYDSKTHGVSKNIKAYLYGMESHLYGDQGFSYAMNALYVGGTVQYDLAVLKIVASEVLMNSHAVACEFADSNDIRVLETAIAVGNAAGNGISATMGKVNVDSEEIQLLAADEKTALSLRVMRTDAAVNSGNSGGGLFNAQGKLIGIVNAKSAVSTADNIGFAIPSNVAKYIAENIIHYCDKTDRTSAYRCLLGITVRTVALYTELDEQTGNVYRKETVAVDSISSETAAANGYLKSGDIINLITIDGKTYEVTRMFHVVDAMFNARAGSNVVVNVTRGEDTLDITVPVSGDDIKNADTVN